MPACNIVHFLEAVVVAGFFGLGWREPLDMFGGLVGISREGDQGNVPWHAVSGSRRASLVHLVHIADLVKPDF